MKITFFIGSTTGGGAEHVICDLASFIGIKDEYQSEILTVTRTKSSYHIDDSVKIFSLDTSIGGKNRTLRKMIKMIKLFIFLVTSKTDMYVVFLPETIRAIMLFRKLIRVPVIVSERSNPWFYSEVCQKQMIKAFAKADAIVFQTEDARNFYSSNIPQMPYYEIIPNAVTGKLPTQFVGKSEKVIVAVGRFKREKNFDLLIKAFARVHKCYPDYELHIYGEGELKEEYISLALELGIEKSLILPGYVPDVPERIKTATMFVLSSEYEGIPNALVEAMAIGLPCVATNCGGGAVSMLIKNMVNGIIVERNDEIAMANAMELLLSDSGLRKKISKSAIKVREELSQERIYSRWKLLIDQII